MKNRIPHRSTPQLETALKKLGELTGWSAVTANVIGALGDVVFEVSTLKVETLKDMKRTAKGRWATHEIVGQKSLLEFVGLEPDEITFDMQLNGDLGVDVQEEIEKLLTLVRSGEANYLILGEHAYGQYQWVVTSVEFEHQYAGKSGQPLFVTASVTLKEALA